MDLSKLETLSYKPSPEENTPVFADSIFKPKLETLSSSAPRTPYGNNTPISEPKVRFENNKIVGQVPVERIDALKDRLREISEDHQKHPEMKQGRFYLDVLEYILFLEAKRTMNALFAESKPERLDIVKDIEDLVSRIIDNLLKLPKLPDWGKASISGQAIDDMRRFQDNTLFNLRRACE